MGGQALVGLLAVPAAAFEPNGFAAERMGGPDVLPERVANDGALGGRRTGGLDAQLPNGGIGLADAYLGALDDGPETGEAVAAEHGAHVAIEIAHQDEAVLARKVLQQPPRGFHTAQHVAVAVVAQGSNDGPAVGLGDGPQPLLLQVLRLEVHLPQQDGVEIVLGLHNGTLPQGALAIDVGRPKRLPRDFPQAPGLRQPGGRPRIGFPQDVRPVQAVGVECAAVVEYQTFDHKPLYASNDTLSSAGVPTLLHDPLVADLHQPDAYEDPKQLADAGVETGEDADAARTDAQYLDN